MTNQQFQTLKKVVKIAQPNLDYAGKAFIHSLLKEMSIEVLNYILHDNLYISFVLKDFSVINVTQDRSETKLTWTNKTKLVKEVDLAINKRIGGLVSTPSKGKTCSMDLKINPDVPDLKYISVNKWLEMGGKVEGFMMLGIQESILNERFKEAIPEISNPTITSPDTGLMLADYLEAGYKLEDVKEVKIIEGSVIEMLPTYIGKTFKTKISMKDKYVFLSCLREEGVPWFSVDEILVTDWQSNLPSSLAGKEITNSPDKFIPLTEWLKSKAPHQVKKARVKGTPIMSETVYLLTNDKVFLDDRTTKYHINQIEVK